MNANSSIVHAADQQLSGLRRCLRKVEAESIVLQNVLHDQILKWTFHLQIGVVASYHPPREPEHGIVPAVIKDVRRSELVSLLEDLARHAWKAEM